MMQSSGAWVDFDCLHFVNNLFLSWKTDEPFDILLPRLFAQMLGKLMFYAKASHGLHVLANSLGELDSPLEIDYLYLSPESQACLGTALRQRQSRSKVSESTSCLPNYTRTTVRGRAAKDRKTELINLVSASSPVYFPKMHSRGEWDRFLGCVNQQRRDAGCAPIDCSVRDILVTSLAAPTPKLPAGLLGATLLWNSDPIANADLKLERLITPSKTTSDYLKQFLTAHYGITESTYLPSYRRPGEREVAILFADIRNFTTTSEILRNFGLVKEWVGFMRRYTEAMCRIITKNGGRVNGMSGDGVMAIFGEYALDRKGAVEPAIGAAKEMCREFRGLRSAFLKEEAIEKFLSEKYEPLEFGFGVGVNFGVVSFDYFGAPGSRVYNPCGDHVNFAQRLESEAGRFDPQLGRERKPILVSRPVCNIVAQGKWPSLVLEVKGKPYKYSAYECNPDE
jgi:class 3 adenylate cyclase